MITENSSKTSLLLTQISAIVNPMGYEVVQIEVQAQRQKILRLYIDRLEGSSTGAPAEKPGSAITVEDCVRVTKALEEPLDTMSELDKLFQGQYELEVSSPGIFRPLAQAKDYERFAGFRVRIHTFRPLTAEEIENAEYQKKNPKQKNFLGTLRGLRGEKVVLEEVTIPLSLISKANLEPDLEA